MEAEETDMNPQEQNRLILDQFTRQAGPFADKAELSKEDVFELIFKTCQLDAADEVLDVACGPGLTSCALARVARQVTGLDLTPAMLERARVLQREKGLTNLNWQLGDVLPLPWPNDRFSLVFTRYSFHHFLDPQAVFAEMVRVCKPGGRVSVVDVYTTSAHQANLYDRMEKLRDPSHVHALDLARLAGFFEKAGLENLRKEFYRLDMNLDDNLAASFPVAGGTEEIKRMVAEDIGVDRIGVGAYHAEGTIRFSYPTVILVGQKGA